MRNLKRALSLALAAAMLIGMMVVGASAVSYNDFSDSEEIVNKDAVSMLTTLGVINGKEDGSYFDPTGNVTRAEMAKMISVMLSNNENCDDLYMTVNSGLTDIANSWARGYINYCYTLDIIAGRGNGTFDPTANVTGVEAAKMLLAALGYEAEIEGLVGTDWDLNTASLAHELGIFRNFTKDVNAPLNRDDAALLIYNAMDVEMIQQYQNGYALTYLDHRTILSSVFGVIRVEGVVVANEWAQLQETDSDAALRTGRTTLDNVVWYDSTTANTVVDEGVRETDPVTFNVTTPVEFMGQAVTMYVEKTTILSNSKVIGVATNDEMNVIVGTADGADDEDDVLDGTGVELNRDTEFYVNYGYCEDQDEAEALISNCGMEETRNHGHGDVFDVNGVEVQVIDNDDDGFAEYVLYTRETLSMVSRYNDRDEILTIFKPELDADGMTTGVSERVGVEFEDVVFNDEVATDDLILYVEYGGRTYVDLADTVIGTMARVDRDRWDELYITLDSGEEFYESHIRDAASNMDADLENYEDWNAREIPGFDDEYEFILDSNGYLVAVRPAEEVVTNYALVLDSAWTLNALRRGGQVEILMADGTTGTYDIDWNDSRDALDGIHIGTGNNVVGADENTDNDLDEKLELYLGTRDVNGENDDTGYRDTGVARGSLIAYSLDEDDTLTIEHIFQGNTFEDYNEAAQPGDAGTIEIAELDTRTAGVGDNGEIVHVGRGTKENQYQSVDADTYSNGRGYIDVRGLAETNPAVDVATGWYTVSANGNVTEHNVVERSRNNDEKTYAVDRNTIAFYYDGDDYAVAIGWDEMATIDEAAHLQVYPVVEKDVNGNYVATDLAEVILFDAMPSIDSNDYMLVLERNAYVKNDLILNVVFEDGTVAEVEINDDGNYDFDEDTDDAYMAAYAYVENSDGTYDIVEDSKIDSTFADLFQNGTVAYTVDANRDPDTDYDGDDPITPDSTGATVAYIAYDEEKANLWDVTYVNDANDEVEVGAFIRNVAVETVIVEDDEEIRTAWMWDIPESVDEEVSPDNQIVRTWANNVRSSSAETYRDIRTAVAERVMLSMSEEQANAANLELQLNGVDATRGQYVIYADNKSDISSTDFGATADTFVEWIGDDIMVDGEDSGEDVAADARLTVFANQDLDDGNVIVIRVVDGGVAYYAAYQIVVD